MSGRWREIQASPDRGPIKTKVLSFFLFPIATIYIRNGAELARHNRQKFPFYNYFSRVSFSLFRLYHGKISGVIFVSSFWSSFGILFFYFPLLSKAKKVVFFSFFFSVFFFFRSVAEISL